ncbi:hypothetical protein [Vibrio hangzhouensis]|uniref:Uncharacterized protein n=1 Tax=Vibrio hangzhouensis TaxID=462991 RepID=A0A1H5S085_9VIBR|nr:hypothetical protein [Vibrio hangzhouensis]SEF44009.1 hypothetical protein SAMN04488244_101197 [Vibrio hangzhouensis]
MNDFILNLIYGQHQPLYRICFRTLLVFMMCWGLLLTVSARSEPTSTAKTESITCSGQLPMKDKRYNGRVIQQQLGALYQADSNFQAALKSNGRMLTDGIFGPVTHQWLVNFCNDYNIISTMEQSTFANMGFVEITLQDLTRATEINTLFPSWRDNVAPNLLLNLNSAQLLTLLAPELLSDSTLEADSSSAVQAAIESYYYQLTNDDLDRQSTLEALTALSKKQFTQRSELNNQFVTLIDQLDVTFSPSLDINKLIQAQATENATQISSETESKTTTQTDTSAKATSDGVDSSANTKDTSTTPTSDDDGKVTQTSTISTTNTTAPLIYWQLNKDALTQALEDQRIYTIPSALQKKLTPIVNQVFASEYLIKAAMVLEGIDVSSEDAINVFSVAKKSGLAPEINTPLVWGATPGCGCQDSRTSIFSDATFYGFFPYWYQAGTQQTINFSQLDRIGLFGAVAKPSSSGSLLVLPPNWSNEPANTQFVRVAHRYRSQVDLVITTPRNLDYVELLNLLDQKLIEQIVDAVSQPVNTTIVNRLKPWLTLGMKPVPSLGDGVTLDIDLSVLNTAESHQQFLTFVRNLKLALLKKANSGVSNNEEVTASADDRYFLNVIVPVNQATSSNASNFYQFDNLNLLSELSNLLIMRPSVPASDSNAGKSLTQEQKAQYEVRQIQQLHQWLSTQSNQLKAEELFKKIVPMLITQVNRDTEVELTQLIHLSSWNFIGAAYQPIPLNQLSQQLIDTTFYPDTSALPPALEAIEQQIVSLMNWICPNRWLLRLILLAVFSGITAVLLISRWYYPLRDYLIQLPFVLLCIGSLLMLMLVFVSDPYFKEYQVPILLGFMGLIVWILLVVRWLTVEGDRP